MKTHLIKLILLSVIIASCAGPEKEPPRRVNVIPVSGTSVPQDAFNSIRHEEDFTQYEFGRMEAVGDPDTMLEETKAYRREKHSSWNLNPQSPYPSTGVKTQDLPVSSNQAMIADYEMRVTQLRKDFEERERAIIEQNQALIEQNKVANAQMENVKKLSKQLLINQQEVLELKKQLEEKKQAVVAEPQLKEKFWKFWKKDKEKP